MHFDANHNLLFVLKGKKSIVLMPPSMTGTVKAMPVSSSSSSSSVLIMRCMPHKEKWQC